MATATVAIDREVWKQVKAAAALQDTTLAEFVTHILREALKKDGQTRTK